MLCGQKQKRSFHSFRVEVALLRYIVFYRELGCDMSEPHVSYISRACSSLVRQPYYTPNCIISKIRGLETIPASKKGRWDGRSFYMDEYTLIFLLSQCIMCAQKRYRWESVRFASERSRIRTARPCRRQGKQSAQCNGDDRSQWLKQGGAVGAAF